MTNSSARASGGGGLKMNIMDRRAGLQGSPNHKNVLQDQSSSRQSLPGHISHSRDDIIIHMFTTITIPAERIVVAAISWTKSPLHGVPPFLHSKSVQQWISYVA